MIKIMLSNVYNMSKINLLEYSTCKYYADSKYYDDDVLGRLLKGKSKKIYKIIRNDIEPELNEIGMKIFILPHWPEVNDYYMKSYPIYFAHMIYGKDFNAYDNSSLRFNFRLDNKNKLITNDINITFSPLSYEKKLIINNIFEKHLPKNFSWSGLNSDDMYISMDDITDKTIMFKNLNITIESPSNINILDETNLVEEFERIIKSEIDIDEIFHTYSKNEIYFELDIDRNNASKVIEKLNKEIIFFVDFKIKCEYYENDIMIDLIIDE